VISIKDLDKAELLAALYNKAKPLGLGYLHYDPTPMTRAEAQAVIDQQGLHFDYLRGRVMKVDLGGDQLRTDLYDQDNGWGSSIKSIQEIKGTLVDPSVSEEIFQETVRITPLLQLFHIEQESCRANPSKPQIRNLYPVGTNSTQREYIVRDIALQLKKSLENIILSNIGYKDAFIMDTQLRSVGRDWSDAEKFKWLMKRDRALVDYIVISREAAYQCLTETLGELDQVPSYKRHKLESEINWALLGQNQIINRIRLIFAHVDKPVFIQGGRDLRFYEEFSEIDKSGEDTVHTFIYYIEQMS
jgi:hypothetical protein